MTDRDAQAAQIARDHVGLSDSFAARRYFRKFEGITGHLARVAAVLHEEGTLSRDEVRVTGAYVQGIAATLRALSLKYLMTGRPGAGPGAAMTIDAHESGFPVARELLVMANDAQQADRHLANMPTDAQLKDDMVRQIVGELAVPTRLQYALSQRLYYQALADGGLFWAANDPDARWQGDLHERRRHYLVHWAVWDSQQNLPVIWLMDLHDTGRRALPKDEGRWPEVQRHLMAQAVSGLKLVTVAQGFDTDFDDLHPVRLRRLTLGPMHSAAYTVQSGPIHDVLRAANAPEGQDWALVLTMEALETDRAEQQKSGWFGTVERQIYRLDPLRGAETGATSIGRALVLPERPYQALAELNPAGLRDVRKFVVGAQGRVLSMR
jgi:hypothetical protein